MEHVCAEKKCPSFLFTHHQPGLLQGSQLAARGAGTDGADSGQLPDIVTVPRVPAKEYQRLERRRDENVQNFEHMFIIMDDFF